MLKQQTIKRARIIALILLVAGMYNAVVINTPSEISSNHVSFVKRLDESLGIITPGRQIAAERKWKKITSIKPAATEVKVAPQSKVIPVASDDSKTDEAAIVEALNLELVEVINHVKWASGLKASEFSGHLATQEGNVEDLIVNLPDGESISVSFSQMVGNVFEYEIEGHLYSAIMYQVDTHSYMVNLTNGPLEGTKLRFGKALDPQEAQKLNETVAQNRLKFETTSFHF
jgi:hypothetical protein